MSELELPWFPYLFSLEVLIDLLWWFISHTTLLDIKFQLCRVCLIYSQALIWKPVFKTYVRALFRIKERVTWGPSWSGYFTWMNCVRTHGKAVIFFVYSSHLFIGPNNLESTAQLIPQPQIVQEKPPLFKHDEFPRNYHILNWAWKWNLRILKNDDFNQTTTLDVPTLLGVTNFYFEEKPWIENDLLLEVKCL